ncbi:uncharacterized protein DNG_08117 [Cephalotrichum gorgonifer]|uniref:Uncharacterized protein n=1 Tax=Cephalotrichum gorgonifer TaxID=2041049 RepID=A0AAE8SY20_9PEZI|nr:uncharacterized protein DNG_08117 [Cephalotrichum gorgonifer]
MPILTMLSSIRPSSLHGLLLAKGALKELLHRRLLEELQAHATIPPNSRSSSHKNASNRSRYLGSFK